MSKARIYLSDDLLGIPVERRPGNPQHLTDLRNRIALVSGKRPKLLDLPRTQCPRSAAESAASPGRRKACECPLPDEVPLELSERSEDMEDQLPPARTGVQLLLQALEVDATALQVLDGVDEMPKRAAETVQSPHDKGVPRS